MAAGDLCTLEDVRLFSQVPASELDGDLITQALISRASAVIRTYCRRQFGIDETATRSFELRAGGLVVLAPWDLRVLTSLSIGETVYTAELGQLQLRPPHKPFGTYDRIRLDPAQLASLTPGAFAYSVEISGEWGITEIPLDVVQACVETVSIWLRRDVSTFSTVLRLDEDSVERPASLPTSAMRKLGPFKRPSIGG